ncbi:unnamed protein product, partial [marine sediment metagenome]
IEQTNETQVLVIASSESESHAIAEKGIRTGDIEMDDYDSRGMETTSSYKVKSTDDLAKEITEDQLKTMLTEFAKKYNQKMVLSFTDGNGKKKTIKG